MGGETAQSIRHAGRILLAFDEREIAVAATCGLCQLINIQSRGPVLADLGPG